MRMLKQYSMRTRGRSRIRGEFRRDNWKVRAAQDDDDDDDWVEQNGRGHNIVALKLTD
jgi:hypothetical protein